MSPPSQIEREKWSWADHLPERANEGDLLEAGAAGYADWLPSNHYPRLQIRTMKDLLEKPRMPVLLPGLPNHPLRCGQDHDLRADEFDNE